jgi:outer membrane lipoprotein-sorting protein
MLSVRESLKNAERNAARLRSEKEEPMSMKRKSFLSKSAFQKSAIKRYALRKLAFSVLCLALAAAPGFARNKKAQKPVNAIPATPAQAGEAKSSAGQGNDLSTVLAKMNQTASSFKTAQGDFEFETYQKIVEETDKQQGTIYFRREGKGVDAAFNIGGRSPKQVVYKDGKIRIYEPRINQITERDVGKNKSEVEAFLSLGFGAKGDDLVRDYDVTMAGWETVNSVKTAMLELVPKDPKLRQTYNKIVLWIDPEQDVLLRQQFFEPSGDYRLARYTRMKRNGPLPDKVFELKTTGHATTIKP